MVLRHLWRSLGRLAVGFGLAAAGGVAAGTLMALSPRARAALFPAFDLLISVPTMAWVPVLLIGLGLGDRTVVAAVFVSAVFAVAHTTARGILLVDADIVGAARLDGADGAALTLHVLLPCAAGAIAAGLRLGLGYAWRALIGAEMLAALVRWGVGKMIFQARFFNDAGAMATGLLAVGACGAALDGAVAWAVRRIGSET